LQRGPRAHTKTVSIHRGFISPIGNVKDVVVILRAHQEDNDRHIYGDSGSINLALTIIVQNKIWYVYDRGYHGSKEGPSVALTWLPVYSSLRLRQSCSSFVVRKQRYQPDVRVRRQHVCGFTSIGWQHAIIASFDHPALIALSWASPTQRHAEWKRAMATRASFVPDKVPWLMFACSLLVRATELGRDVAFLSVDQWSHSYDLNNATYYCMIVVNQRSLQRREYIEETAA
jgi:hypothetical protein